MEKIFIFDLDGTLANHKNVRGPFDEHKVHLDEPIVPVISVLKSLIPDYKIIFMSGRTDKCYASTSKWISNHVGLSGFTFQLYMRRAGDNRPDDIVKEELYNEYIKDKYSVVAVVDDRLRVCAMWYKLNIFCFNVNQGLKEF